MPTTMSVTDRRYWWLLAFALLLLGAGIGLRDPWPTDEPRYALVAKQMVDSGQWLFPRRGIELYSDKPPLFMWKQATAYHLTGSWRVAFLLPALLSGLLTLVLVHDLARRLHGRRVAWVATAALLFTIHFTFQTRAGQIDGTLIGIFTLACYGLLRHLLLGPDRRWLLIGCFFAGIGTITKGVAFLALLLLPLAWVARRLGVNGLVPPSAPGAPRLLLPAMLAFLLAVSLWLVPMLTVVWTSGDPTYRAYADDILFGQTAKRYLAADHHLHPPWYYLGVIATLWLPVAFALWWALPHWIRGWRRGHRPAAVWLPLALTAVIVLFFSLSDGKRDVYILPALPMFVLAVAPLLPVLLKRISVQRVLFGFAMAISLVLTAVSSWALLGEPEFAERMREQRGLEPWPIPLAMGLIGLTLALVLRARRGALVLAGTLTAIWLNYGFWAYPVLNDSRSARGAMQAAGQRVGPDAELALLGWKPQNLLMADRPTTVFGYLRPRAEQEIAAVAWLREKPDLRYVIAQTQSLEACFHPDRAHHVGQANRRDWYVAGADALRDECLAHPPEAWTEYKIERD